VTGHTDEEIDRAAARFEQLADELDPSTVTAERLDDLASIARAADAIRFDESRLREAVAAARSRGRSWNEIAAALGVSRQAARQRFGRGGADNAA
jgi:DNA-directed RNA polymerase specialized sigma24 family protein